MPRKVAAKSPRAAKKTTLASAVAAELIRQGEPDGTDLTLLEPTPPPDDDEEFDPWEDVHKLITEQEGGAEGNATIRVHKMHANQPRPSYCMAVPAGEFHEDKLRDMYGGGNYRVQLFGRLANRGNRYGIIRTWIMPIEPPLQAKGADGAPAPNGQYITRAEMLELMQRREVQTNPLDQMDATLALMRNVREVIIPNAGGGGGQQQNSLSMLKEMLQITEMLQGAAGSLFPGMGGGGAAKSSPTDVFASAAAQLIPVLVQGMQQRQAETQNNPGAGNFNVLPHPRSAAVPPDPDNPRRQHPGGTRIEFDAQPVTVRGTTMQPPTTPEHAEQVLMLQMLCIKAKAGADPVLASQFLLESVPDVDLDTFDGFLKQPNWFELMCAQYAGCQPFKPWFELVRRACIENLADDGLEPEQPGAAAGTGSAPPPP
jgi:hypothetical protein